MKERRTKISLRIPRDLFEAASQHADATGQTRHALFSSAVEAGLLELIGDRDRPSLTRSKDILDMIAAAEDRISHIERLAKRTLYSTLISYGYARQAALKPGADPNQLDLTVTEIANAAFERQLAQARELEP